MVDFEPSLAHHGVFKVSLQARWQHSRNFCCKRSVRAQRSCSQLYIGFKRPLGVLFNLEFFQKRTGEVWPLACLDDAFRVKYFSLGLMRSPGRHQSPCLGVDVLNSLLLDDDIAETLVGRLDHVGGGELLSCANSRGG